MTKQLNISIFENYLNIKAIQEKTLTIEQFYKSLSDYITKTKAQNYKNLDVEKVKSKKILGIVPVLFDNKRRHADSMSISKRCMITIDIDSFAGTLEELIIELNNKFSELCYVTYTTAKSTIEKPRIRLIFFLREDFSVTTKQEQDLYKKKIQGFCKKYFGDSIINRDKRPDGEGHYITFTRTIYDDKFEIDDASYQANRLMLLPFFYDTEPFLYMNEGELVDLETIEIQEAEEKVKAYTSKQRNVSIDNSTTEDDRNVAELAKLLSNLQPSELSYQERLNVGYVIKYEYQGSVEGQEMFANWCLLDNTRTSSTEAIISEANASYKSMPEAETITIRRYYVYSLIVKIANTKRVKLDIEVSYIPIPKQLFPDISIKKDGNIKILTTYANIEFMLDYYNTNIYLDLVTKEVSSEASNSINTIKSLVVSLVHINNIADYKVCERLFLTEYALKKQRNRFAELIRETKWDGIDRLTDFCNTIKLAHENEDYIKKLNFLNDEDKSLETERVWLIKKMKNVYIKAWLKQMIYLHMNTDTQKKSPRYLLCMQGKEQIGKTFWSRALVPSCLPANYFYDGGTIKQDSDSEYKKVIESVFTELGELGNTLRRIGTDRFKQIFSSTEDKLNLKYKDLITFPRLTSFVATLNDVYFLNNQDEHTRFLILNNVVGVDGKHGIDMAQLYAQIHENEDWYNFELTEEERVHQKELNKVSVMTDEMEELVNQYFFDAETSKKKLNKNYYSCVEVLNIVGYKDANVKNSANILAKLLTKLGYYRRLDSKKFLIVQK